MKKIVWVLVGSLLLCSDASASDTPAAGGGGVGAAADVPEASTTQEEKDNLLCIAVRDSTGADKVRSLCAQGANPNATYSFGDDETGEQIVMPALYAAVMLNYVDSVKILLEFGADPTIRIQRRAAPGALMSPPGHNSTPVHYAAKLGHVECLKLLLSDTPSASKILATRDVFGRNALDWAAMHAQLPCLQLLFEAHRAVNGESPLDPIVLYYALFGDPRNRVWRPDRFFNDLSVDRQHKRLECFEFLIGIGVDVNGTMSVPSPTAPGFFDSRMTILHVIAQEGCMAACELLAKEPFLRVDSRASGGATAEFIARERGHNDIVANIVRKRAAFEAALAATPELSGRELEYQLLDAAAHGNLEGIKDLFTRHPAMNRNPIEHGNHTPLHLAVCRKHYECARYLLENGADVTIQDENGMTPLHLACANGRTPHDIIQALIERSGNLNIRDRLGNTPLHYASGYRYFEHTSITTIEYFAVIIGFLHNKGADLNLQNNNGDTALHVAARHGHLRIVRCLVSYGAWGDIKNNAQQIPVEVAAGENAEAIRAAIRAQIVRWSELRKGFLAAVLGYRGGPV